MHKSKVRSTENKLDQQIRSYINRSKDQKFDQQIKIWINSSNVVSIDERLDRKIKS